MRLLIKIKSKLLAGFVCLLIAGFSEAVFVEAADDVSTDARDSVTQAAAMTLSSGRNVMTLSSGRNVMTLSSGRNVMTLSSGRNVSREALRRSSRIVGGTVSQGYPWIVALLERGINDTFRAHLCGGALVGSRWVLTAAHCLATSSSLSTIRPASSFDVLIGVTQLGGSSSSRVRVVNVTTHPDYEEFLFPDLALLELEFDVSNAPTIKLESGRSNHDPVGTLSKVAGWGLQSESGLPSDQLLEAEVPVTTHSVCDRAYDDDEPIVKSAMICAGFSEGGVDACGGDSGGPLFVNDPDDGLDWLIGIVSFGSGCARPNVPGVYARVATFSPWLEGIMGLRSTPNPNGGRLAAEFSVVCKRLRCIVDAAPTKEGPSEITHYTWVLGDGWREYGRRVAHVYDEAGEYRIGLHVTDSSGRIRRLFKRVRISDTSPTYDHRISRVWAGRISGTGGKSLLPDPFGFYADKGRIRGILNSTARNLDLSLQHRDDATGRWSAVSRRTDPGSNELLRYTAREPGYYRWKVYSKRGRGTFDLRTKYP